MSWIEEFPVRLAQLEVVHLRRRRREVMRADAPHLIVDGQRMLAFCSNDYLGLACHPALVHAACLGAYEFGVGAGASPLVSGHITVNADLERDLAKFVQLPTALYFYAGFPTNSGIVPALVGEGDAIFSDLLNHASLIDGARLSRASIIRYPHADLEALERELSESPVRRKLVITDAVFSMDGDIADVPALVGLCERYDALLLLDDAHGFGVLGPQGRGTLAHFGFTAAGYSPRVIYMATLGKAAGVAGAFVAGTEPIIEWLLQKTRSYIFATAAPPMLACALSVSLHLIENEDDRRINLQQGIAQLRDGLTHALRGTGWYLGESATAIQPLVIGSNEQALAVMEGLARSGIWVPAIRPPSVPEGTARLRIALSAIHTASHIAVLIEALAKLAAHHRH